MAKFGLFNPKKGSYFRKLYENLFTAPSASTTSGFSRRASAGRGGGGGKSTVTDPRKVSALEQSQDMGDILGVTTEGGSSTGSTFAPTWFMGRLYNDASSLSKAMEDYYRGAYGTQTSELERTYGLGKGDIETQGRELEAEVPAERTQGLLDLSKYYSSIAPDVYQSAQGSGEQMISGKAEQKLTEGRTALERAMENLNIDYQSKRRALDEWLQQQLDTAKQVMG
jgi:hypothetical protein